MRINAWLLICAMFALSCNGDETKNNTANNKAEAETATEAAATGKKRHFKGLLTGGMKGDSIFFDVSEDGRKLDNLTFKGYWRCDGKLESSLTGPEGAFDIVNNKVSGHISEPPDGGSTAWRFDLTAEIKGNTASGTFRMNINNLGCDSYLLQWTAIAE